MSKKHSRLSRKRKKFLNKLKAKPALNQPIQEEKPMAAEPSSPGGDLSGAQTAARPAFEDIFSAASIENEDSPGREGPISPGLATPWIKENWRAQIKLRLWHFLGILNQHHGAFRMLPPDTIFTTGSKNWASFDPADSTISLSEELILRHPWHVTESFIAHEVIHHYLFKTSGKTGDEYGTHSDEFRRLGELLGVHPFYLTDSVESVESTPFPMADTVNGNFDPKVSAILSKLDKIMALASSAQSAEAESALAAAARLLAKYNIEALELEQRKTRLGYLIIPLNRCRVAGQTLLIEAILRDHFSIYAVRKQTYHPVRNRHEWTIEISGRPENILFAEHVYHFLNERIDTLWKKYSYKTGATGRTSRYSFQIMLLNGFARKLEEASKALENKELTGGAGKHSELILLKDQDFAAYIAKRYKNVVVSKVKFTKVKDYESGKAGLEMGKRLQVSKPLRNGSNANPSSGMDSRLLPGSHHHV
ncbi:MAG: SprT-like domain-containing protein [Deltaproteobacteria bacterium]|jgi:hypothetical protein|nr:SprT-like domain-containing protein [Deltaproteobacteria bacterium]